MPSSRWEDLGSKVSAAYSAVGQASELARRSAPSRSARGGKRPKAGRRPDWGKWTERLSAVAWARENAGWASWCEDGWSSSATRHHTARPLSPLPKRRVITRLAMRRLAAATVAVADPRSGNVPLAYDPGKSEIELDCRPSMGRRA